MQIIAMNKLTLPNTISGLRLMMSFPAAFFTCQRQWVIAGIIVLTAIATDFLDGWVARRRSQSTAFGGLLDHGSDAIFVIATLAALSAIDVVPVLLPILVAVAFLQYVLDSSALSGRPLRASLLGRYNGIAYFILVSVVIGQEALQLHLINASWILWAAWALIVSTLVSISDRLIALLKLHLPD